MISGVATFEKKNRVTLYFDGLIPEEAHKILDVLFMEDMDEALGGNFIDTELTYDVNGYRFKDSQKVWSHELVLTIETPEVDEAFNNENKDKMLEEDRRFLENLRETILERTGIIEDEES